MTTATDKIAGAPISWGVCEVPGWGYQLSPERVLTEMQQVGLAATEFGPDGFLPADPAVMAEVLASRHLTAVGGFTPVVLHEAGHDPVPGIDRLLDSYDAVARGGARAVRRHRSGRLRHPARAGRGRLDDRCSPTSTGSPPWPPRAASARSCTRTSAPWSNAVPRSSACSRDRPSRCAWTPVTC